MKDLNCQKGSWLMRRPFELGFRSGDIYNSSCVDQSIDRTPNETETNTAWEESFRQARAQTEKRSRRGSRNVVAANHSRARTAFFVPSFDDLPHTDGKRKGLLAKIFSPPKFRVQITALAVTCTVDSHVLTACGVV